MHFRLADKGCPKGTKRETEHVEGPRACLWLSGKESVCQCRRYRRCVFNSWVRKIPWRRRWHPTPVFLPGKFHGQRSLAGYSPWGCRVRHNLVTKQHLRSLKLWNSFAMEIMFSYHLNLGQHSHFLIFLYVSKYGLSACSMPGTVLSLWKEVGSV